MHRDSLPLGHSREPRERALHLLFQRFSNRWRRPPDKLAVTMQHPGGLLFVTLQVVEFLQGIQADRCSIDVARSIRADV